MGLREGILGAVCQLSFPQFPEYMYQYPMNDNEHLRGYQDLQIPEQVFPLTILTPRKFYLLEADKYKLMVLVQELVRMEFLFKIKISFPLPEIFSCMVTVRGLSSKIGELDLVAV